MASASAAAGGRGEEGEAPAGRFQLTPAAKTALRAAVLSAIRHPTGEFDAGCLQRAMSEGLPKQAVLNAAVVARQRAEKNREERSAMQQQLGQLQRAPAPSSNDAKCTASKTTEIKAINYPNGDVYEGELKDGQPSGTGTFTATNGNVYEGDFKDGMLHGKGKLRWRNGNVYEGDFVQGKMHGKGEQRWENGNSYEGQWTEAKKHGQGTFRWTDGRVYEGEFVDGKEHGWGTMAWPSGNVHVGQWLEGEQHGRGTLTLKNGDVYEGEWADGQPTRGWKTRCHRDTGAARNFAGSNAREDLARLIPAVGATSASSVLSCANNGARSGSAAPDASGRKQPEKKRIYNERKLRSQQSQQRRLQNSTTSKTCENCGVNDDRYKLRVCTGCNLALYCSAACQKAASGSHRRICDIVSGLPPRDADALFLRYDRESMVDLDAGLRYATKYMDNLKHLVIDMEGMGKNDTAKLSAKMVSSLLRSKNGALDSVSWASSFSNYTPGISVNGEDLWKELHGVKQLQLRYIFDGEHFLHGIIGQQKNTLLLLCLEYVEIGWHKAKCRRAFAQAVNSCKHLANLSLDQCVLMDPDLKVMLQDLPNLRILRLVRHSRHTHEFTDNTCGLIARKCPGLQQLILRHHNQLSVRGIRKIFGGCVHLRSFCTTTRKLSSGDIRELLEIAPQLLFLSVGDDIDISKDELSQVVEATGGRTVLGAHSNDGAFKPDSISAETKEKYDSQIDVLRNIWKRHADPDVANEWEDLYVA